MCAALQPCRKAALGERGCGALGPGGGEMARERLRVAGPGAGAPDLRAGEGGAKRRHPSIGRRECAVLVGALRLDSRLLHESNPSKKRLKRVAERTAIRPTSSISHSFLLAGSGFSQKVSTTHFEISSQSSSSSKIVIAE